MGRNSSDLFPCIFRRDARGENKIFLHNQRGIIEREGFHHRHGYVLGVCRLDNVLNRYFFREINITVFCLGGVNGYVHILTGYLDSFRSQHLVFKQPQRNMRSV